MDSYPVWQTAAERAIKVFALFLIVIVVAAGIGLLDVPWPVALTIAGFGALLSVLTFVVDFIAGFTVQRRRLAAHQELVQAAERAVPPAGEPNDEPGTGRAGAPAVSLDARLAVRYRRARAEAEAEVRRYLPTNPRTAKRMVNHVSLAMAIAAERGIFHDSAITQQHLGKWVGITEQWPALGAALITAPARMIDLEKTATLAELQAVLDTIAPGTVASEELRRRLRDGVPLSGVLERLVRFEPS